MFVQPPPGPLGRRFSGSRASCVSTFRAEACLYIERGIPARPRGKPDRRQARRERLLRDLELDRQDPARVEALLPARGEVRGGPAPLLRRALSPRRGRLHLLRASLGAKRG